MRRSFSLRGLLLTVATLGVLAQAHAAEQPLHLDVYNPGSEALFPVSSVIVSGKHDAILVDAQFGKAQAEQVLAKLRASGKRLTTIYISHGDPDYYFGLQTLTDAYPQAKVVASAATVAHIKQTMDAKLAYWGPQMGADKPGKLVVPQVLEGNQLTVEDQRLEVVGLEGPTTLKRIELLKPQVVVPGHYLGEPGESLAAVRFTADYIRAFDEETAKAANAAELIAAMKKRYPDLGEESSLELSAKVAKGEMKW